MLQVNGCAYCLAVHTRDQLTVRDATYEIHLLDQIKICESAALSHFFGYGEQYDGIFNCMEVVARSWNNN